MRLVKRYAIDQVIQRRIVDSRRIAGLVDASAGGRVSAATGLAGPHLRLAEANGVNSRLYGVVLHRVDFAEEEISFPTVGHGRNRCSSRCSGHSGIRCTRRWTSCRSSRAGRTGNHQHSI